MTREIAVAFDYRCPFARNGHEAVVGAERNGALPDVTWRYLPFSLDQAHAEEGEARSGSGGRTHGAVACSRCCTGWRFVMPSPTTSSTRTSRSSQPAMTTAARSATRTCSATSSLRSASTPTRLRRRCGAAAPQDPGRRALRGRRAVGRVRCPDLLRRRHRRVHPLHGTRPRRRSRAGGRPARVGQPQRVQATPHPALAGIRRVPAARPRDRRALPPTPFARDRASGDARIRSRDRGRTRGASARRRRAR